VASGNYDVLITQSASKGTHTGTGFGGTYVDDGTADTLTVEDLDAGSEYSVSLTDGMTLSQIVSALNSEFATETTHEVQAAEGMYQDALGTVATAATTLDSLFDSRGTSFGIADGDVISISGTRRSGESFYRDFTVTDVTSQTLGDLRSAIEAEVGSDEIVSFQDGFLNLAAQETGRSLLTLSVSSDNAGGGTFTMGTFDAVTEGRGTANITASDSGGELKLDHGDYGSAAGFEISYSAGGADGSASLGLAAGTYAGTDVQGTIGGLATKGVGQILTGEEDTSIEGLMIRYEGTDTGAVGSVTFSRGVASMVEVATDLLLGTGIGSIDSVVEGIDPLIDRLNQRIDTIEGRLERRREALIRKFTALEEAMARAQSQAQWLSSHLQSLSASTSSN
jgi:flagellar hook-associated protein 2